MIGYLGIAGTIIFTVYGQLVIKWRVSLLGQNDGIWSVILKSLMDPLTITGYASAFIGSLCWLITVKNLPLSFAYPFMSLNIAIVIILEKVFWNTEIQNNQYFAIGLVMLGLIVMGFKK